MVREKIIGKTFDAIKRGRLTARCHLTGKALGFIPRAFLRLG
jgi:hypothetical protein